MPQSFPRSEEASFESRTSRWNSSKLNHEKRVVEVDQEVEAPYRVLIVDRDSMSSNLLANALVRGSRCEAAAIHAADLLHALATREVDLVVIGAELSVQTGNGLDLAQTVCSAHPGACIVILLNSTTHEAVISAFRAGARGVFSRQQSIAEFIDCVEHVRKGFIWAGKLETDTLLEAFKNIPAPNLVTAPDSPTLTARELQVVQCAAKGMTNRTIASELGLSEHTVKNYLFRAFDKLGVSSRVELLFYLTIRGHTFGAAKTPEVVGDPSAE